MVTNNIARRKQLLPCKGRLGEGSELWLRRWFRSNLFCHPAGEGVTLECPYTTGTSFRFSWTSFKEVSRNINRNSSIEEFWNALCAFEAPKEE